MQKLLPSFDVADVMLEYPLPPFSSRTSHPSGSLIRRRVGDSCERSCTPISQLKGSHLFAPSGYAPEEHVILCFTGIVFLLTGFERC